MSYISGREVLLVHVFAVEQGMDCVHALLCSDIAYLPTTTAGSTVGNIVMMMVADEGPGGIH